MKRIYLLVSAAGVFAIGLSYGIAPASFLPRFLDLAIEGTDLTHIFRALMGLYTAMIALWIAGAFNPKLTRAAILSEVVFMGGLASGRLISLVVDGIPSPLLLVYMILEILFTVSGIWLLRKNGP